MAQRIRPSTRTMIDSPILPSSRVISGVARNDSRVATDTAAIAPMPSAAPGRPSSLAWLA